MVKIIKNTATVILFIICAMFILRCCMVADKSVFDELYLTDALTSAAADGIPEVKTVKVEREIADDGYFSAYAFYYVPENGEVQVTVRWNDSVYDYTSMTEGHEYSFHLLNETTGETFPLEAIDAKKRSIYNYRKLDATSVSLGEADTLTVVMELRDGFESTQVVRFGEQPLEEYRLSRAERRELGG